jgi:molecular chaperone GrpE
MQGNAWVDGVALIKTKFLKLLEEHDIEVLDPVGEEFNPNHHQAIGTGESDQYESGHVVETLQKGYLSGKILLRPALVTVAS